MTYQLSQFTFDNSEQILGQTPAGQDILLGGFSGLYFDTEEDGKYYFYTVPDRGPNGEPTDTDGDGINERPFALPDYQARIIRLVYDPELGTVEIDNTIFLTREDGTTPITGKPNLQADEQGLAYTDEIPIDLKGNVLTNDPFGADLESIIKAPDGTFWASDEYRPAIYHFDENGVLLHRFIPQGTAAANGDLDGTYGTETLPEIYAQRRANRGFEGMALDTDKGKLYAWIQSPIDNPDVSNNANSRNSVVLRILEVNPTNGEPTGEYIQILNDTDKAVDKIGDAVYKGDGKFLVIERDSAVGEDSEKFVFEIDINNATNILGTPLSEATGSFALEGKTEAEITAIDSLDINLLGSYETGLEGGAEIAAYDADTNLLFVTNGANNSVDVIHISDPTNPTLVDSFDMGSFFGGINSVAAKDGVLAIAVQANDVTDNGFIILNDFGRNGEGVRFVPVGALPDMVTFTPDGNKILVANEGEPNEDYTIDPEGSVSIIDIANGFDNITVNTAGFQAFNDQEAELKAAGVRIFGLNASVAEDVEPEYIAVSPDGSTAFVTLQENNAVAVVDINNTTITDVIPLGFKDHSLAGNGLDASDRDDAINIQNWPVFGMYQPDSIASFQIGEETYYITANEGDARLRPTDDGVFPPPNDEEGDIFNEEARIKDVVLDPTAFPNAEELQQDENMGRLNITNTLGDTDGDGDFDQLYAYGARSFSIWDSAGNLVFDSGDQLEQITAALFPELFNSQGDEDSFDNRSDNKGPEPEGLTVGTINDRTYAFIGLERIGGFMTYDVTDPTAPKFVNYLNDTDLGNISPEGLLFIPSPDSPTNQDLLVVTNEVSGNTVIYSVEPDTGIQSVEKTFLFNAAELGYTAGDKPEGLALLPDGDIALLNDNDFGLLGEEIPGDGSVPINPEPVPIVLGIVQENQPFTLQILHASDQEAGVPAFQDIPGLSAVMNALEDDYENTLKLTSGDIFIAGPFFDGSREIYDDTNDNEPIGQPGIADILIQNELGWDVASVGNHEFDAGDETFFDLLPPNENWINGANGGVGIGEGGYPGALFPYLANNLDYSNASLPDGLTVVENGGSPLPNTLTGSVVTEVNGEEIGIIGIVTPYVESIANTGDVGVTTDDPDGNPITPSSPIEVQVDSIIANITPEVEALMSEGVNKLILMTHLQESAIEQALAQEMADLGLGVDVLIGGGSHQVMANGDGVPPLREDETQQTNGQLLQPYPQLFSHGEETVYYVNTGANYRYLSQLVVTFNEEGEIVSVGDDSGTYATDIAGVDRLYEEDITTIEEVKAKADPDVVEIVEGVEKFVNDLDGNIFGQTDVFLNGTRGDVRTQETNLGNLTADAQDYYAEAYLDEHNFLEGFEEIHISFKNGGGIRDNIGVSFIAGGTNELIQLPPQANPAVAKEEGDVSQLDISNSLRFNNDLVAGIVTADGLLQIAEHAVSGVEFTSGRFAQISGFKFSFNPDAPSGSRIENLALTNEDGESTQAIVEDGELVVDADQTFSIVTLGFLAGGGDGYPDVIQNQVNLSDLAEPDELSQANLESGSEQDALAEYLSAFYNEDSGQDPYAEADTPRELDDRIQNLNFREDTVLDGLEPPQPSVPMVVSGTPNADVFDSVFPDEGQFVGENQILLTGGGDDTVDVTYAVGSNTIRTASGSDMIFAGTNNRIDAGTGDDLLFLGSGGGNNRVTGGLGADQFWISEDDTLFPTHPNIIGDYDVSQGDVIGFAATSLTWDSLGSDWNLVQDGLNTVIEAFGQDIAILNGIDVSTLTEANFVFA